MAAAALVASPGIVFADDFEFEAELKGDGTLEWAFENTESFDIAFKNGAEYNYSGGAGADGEAMAKGEYTGTGGIFADGAAGYGLAYSDTDGNNYAEAGFASASLSANAGYAGDQSFTGDTSKIEYSGLSTVGGAGSVETGLTFGVETTYANSGSGSYDVDADLSGSYSD